MGICLRKTPSSLMAGPMLVLRFDVESAYALGNEPPTEANWKKWIDESLAGVKRIVEILNEFNASATFFVVGLLLEKAGEQYAELLNNHPNIDIQSHTYSHCRIKPPNAVSLEKLGQELDLTSNLIVKYFKKAPIGLCAPGNFVNGLQGCSDRLRFIWNKGYRFIGSDGESPEFGGAPAPFTQPYWYAEEGFSDFLELPITGWHCNMLTNSGGQTQNRQPAPGFPDGSILRKLPTTEKEAFAVRKKELEYAISRNLVYAPGMHPWSIYRFGNRLDHLRMLVDLARKRNVPIVNCLQLYNLLKAKKGT